MTTIEKLERFIDSDVAAPGDAPVGPGTDLVEQGVLDSLGLVKLLEFISHEFGVVISDDDVQLENFASIRAIEALIARKRA